MRSLTAFHCAASTRSRWEGVVPLARVCLRMSLVMVLLSLAAAGALAQQRVGINAAVNTDATGTPPSGAAKKLARISSSTNASRRRQAAKRRFCSSTSRR